jgi:hypothetical protein
LSTILATKAWADAYVAPVCAKVTIRSKIDNSILHEFNSFDGTNNDIALNHIDIAKALGQTGTFQLNIDDTLDRAIDIDKVDCGNLVTIQLGRDTADFRNMFTGYTETIRIDRKGENGIFYTIVGLGSAAYTNQIIVNVEKSAPLDTDGKPIPSPQYFANLLMDELFSSSEFLPLRTGSVATICGFTLDKISSKVNEFIPSLSFNYVYASQVAAAIADLVGADFYVDDNNVVVFQYPSAVHSGIKVKTIVDANDLAYNTSYILGGYSVTHSIRPSDGFGTQFFGISDIALGQVASNVVNNPNSFASLYHKDVGQQIPIEGTKFSNLALRLSKVGTGTSESDPLTAKLFGRILQDDGNNNPDGMGEIARFTIPIASILEQPSVILKLDLQFKSDAAALRSNENVWIVLYNIGDSEENTVRWWHDNQVNKRTPNYNSMRTLPYGRTAKSYSLTNKMDNDSIYSNFGWFNSLNGPTYSYSVVSKVSHLNVTRNLQAMNRWGRVDVKIDMPSLSDTDKTQMQFMNSLLEHASKKIVTFNTPQVTIPLSNFFVPGSTIQFIDPIIGFTADKNIQAQIHEVKYSLDANGEDGPLGTNRCEINPVWFMSAGDYINT